MSFSNLLGDPIDYPQREKMAGDAHIAIETGLYNFNVYVFVDQSRNH